MTNGGVNDSQGRPGAPAGRELRSAHEAFLAMTDYIWRYAQVAYDGPLTLAGDTDIMPRSWPVDPAAWGNWLDSVRRIRRRQPPRTDP